MHGAGALSGHTLRHLVVDRDEECINVECRCLPPPRVASPANRAPSCHAPCSDFCFNCEAWVVWKELSVEEGGAGFAHELMPQKSADRVRIERACAQCAQEHRAFTVSRFDTLTVTTTL